MEILVFIDLIALNKVVIFLSLFEGLTAEFKFSLWMTCYKALEAIFGLTSKFISRLRFYLDIKNKEFWL